MPNPLDPNGLRIGHPIRISEADSHERTNERTDVDTGADVDQETAVDADARIEDLTFSGHRYGPHRPEDAPATVVIGTYRNWVGDEREVPIHPAVLRQRERINQLATTPPPVRPEPGRVAAREDAL